MDNTQTSGQDTSQPQEPSAAEPAPPAAPPPAEPAPEEKPAEPAPAEPVPAEPPAEPTPAAEAPAEPAPAPTAPTAPTEAAEKAPLSEECDCPEINAEQWDKKKPQINKMFYKAFSPRLLNYPFSFVIDVDRARQGAKKAGYTIPEKPMILATTKGIFWGSVMIEVEGAKEGDKNVVSLAGKDLYTKVSKNPLNKIKPDIKELETELGKKPSTLYVWNTTCPKCQDKKEVKTVLIAIP